MIIDGNLATSIAQAAKAIAQGQLVGMPTETVYGLAADADNATAVAHIFSQKGRPSSHPLIVHVAAAAVAQPNPHLAHQSALTNSALTASLAQSPQFATTAGVAGAAHFAEQIPEFAQKLMRAFWPGPLTLIVPRRAAVGREAAGGQNSIGLRCPSHPVAQALLQACAALGVHGLAAPSANLFGRVSPTTAAHVAAEFDATLLVLDGGACEVGIESSIVDCTRGQPVLLRPGGVTRDQIEAACGLTVLSNDAANSVLTANAPRASGTLEAHYAPRAKVRLMDAKTLQTALDVLGTEAKNMAVYARSSLRSDSKNVLFQPMPDNPELVAQQLFAVLRALDAQGVALIWVEQLPASVAWEGVQDRLQRAAAA